MQEHLQELAMDAQRMLELQMAGTTKCLSCGQTGVTRASGGGTPPSSPRLRSPSPPHDAVACSPLASLLVPAGADKIFYSTADSGSGVPTICQPHWPPATNTVASRPNSASRARKHEGDFPAALYASTVSAVMGRSPP